MLTYVQGSQQSSTTVNEVILDQYYKTVREAGRFSWSLGGLGGIWGACGLGWHYGGVIIIWSILIPREHCRMSRMSLP